MFRGQGKKTFIYSFRKASMETILTCFLTANRNRRKVSRNQKHHENINGETKDKVKCFGFLNYILFFSRFRLHVRVKRNTEMFQGIIGRRAVWPRRQINRYDTVWHRRLDRHGTIWYSSEVRNKLLKNVTVLYFTSSWNNFGSLCTALENQKQRRWKKIRFRRRKS